MKNFRNFTKIIGHKLIVEESIFVWRKKNNPDHKQFITFYEGRKNDSKVNSSIRMKLILIIL